VAVGWLAGLYPQMALLAPGLRGQGPCLMAGRLRWRRAGTPGRRHGSLWKKGLVFYRRKGDGGWPFAYPVAVAEVAQGGVADEFPGQRVLAGGGRVGGEYRDAGQAVGAGNGCSAGPG